MTKPEISIGTWCDGCKKICLNVASGICENCAKTAKEVVSGRWNIVVTFRDESKITYIQVHSYDFTEKMFVMHKNANYTSELFLSLDAILEISIGKQE